MSVWTRTAPVLLVLLLGLAQAQVVTPFAKRYETNDRGDIRMVGNTLMCASGSGVYGCNTSTMNNPSANNNVSMVFLNADPTNPPGLAEEEVPAPPSSTSLPARRSCGRGSTGGRGLTQAPPGGTPSTSSLREPWTTRRSRVPSSAP